MKLTKTYLLQRNKFSVIFFLSVTMILGLAGISAAGFFLVGKTLGLTLGLVALGITIILIVCDMITFSQMVKPIQALIRETEETLQGLRESGISLVRDDEIGVLANNFNQIIMDAQMKRMELENSNLELASRAEIIEKTYRELDKKVYDLFTLFNIGKELNSTLSVESILKITCFTCMGQLGVTVMTIMLLDEKNGTTIMPVYKKGLRKDPERPKALQVKEAFLELLKMNEQPLLFGDLKAKPQFGNEVAFFEAYKCFLIAPLLAKDQVIGMLLLGKKLSGESFSQGERDFITTLTSLAALALRNARHYEQAITDAMTQLYLKRYFQLRFEDELKRADRYDGKLTLLMADIDHFKRVNDTYGHTKGDQVLIAVSKTIKDNFRDVDVPARYGGEEFAVIMPEVGKHDALIAAERLRKSVEKLPFVLNGTEVQVTISLGLAEFPEDGRTPLALIESADAALYQSKANGRNRATLA